VDRTDQNMVNRSENRVAILMASSGELPPDSVPHEIARSMQSNLTSRMLFLPILLLSLWSFTTGQTMSPPTPITQAIDETKLVSLPGNVHPLARPEFDQGSVPAAQRLRRMLLLMHRDPKHESALQKFLEDRQNKSSPNYQSWLTPQEFGEQFGASDADVSALTAWLLSSGFREVNVTAGRTVIEFSGTAGQVRKAFHTEIHRYVVNGEEHIANSTDPQIPGALATVIAGIVSLHDFRKKPMYRLAGFPATERAGATVASAGLQFTNTSCFDGITGSPATCHPVGPYDFATIYNVLPLWNAAPSIDGTGQTVAIVARTNINVQDVADFRNLFGLPPNPPQIVLDGLDPGLVPGDETEADLDVEWSGAVAKGATIKLVVSESTETTDGVDLSALYIVDHNLASVMSESYGQCEFNMGTAGNQFYNNLWQQAAAQGITVFVSSGDNGSAGCDFELDQGQLPPQPAQYGLQVNGIASTPYNVAVGGTDFNDYFNSSTYWNAANTSTTLASARGYIPETTWNSSCTNALLESPDFPLSTNPEANCNNPNISQFAVALGGSGGMSNCTAPTGTTVSSCSGGYPKPLWQVATGVPNDGKRDLPDVSLLASSGFENSFYMMCEADISNQQPCSTSNYVGVGGTSASSPAFAGLLALVNQKTSSRQGNANYVFYSLAAKQSSLNCNSNTGPASTCIFNDVTSGTIAMPCVTGSPNCTTTKAGDQIGILAGYQARAGYDQATGLGSVNAANLVNSWNSASGAASTTTLTLNGGNAVNVTHGTPVSVAVSVSPTSPQPTGLASLIATQGSNSFGVDTLTISNGAASGTANMLPGGASYTVQARYAGDADYAASDSNSVTVTVNPEPSSTNVHVAVFNLSTGQVSNENATSIPYGSVYLPRADVSNASGSTCFNPTGAALSYACPSGTVSFALDGAPLSAGPSALNSQGYTENLTVQLATGSHSLTGSYSGDNSYLASSGTDSVTVAPAPTILGPGSNSPLPIGPYSFNFFVRSANFGNFPVPPTGTFTIFDNGSQLASTLGQAGNGVIYPGPGSPYVWVTFGGNLYFTLPGPAGPHTLTLNYSGDANYQPSTSGPFPVTEVYPTTLQLTPSAPTIQDGQPLTVTAQIVPSQSAGVSPTGTVTFYVNAVNIGTMTVANGQARITTVPPISGNVFINATYTGDTNYAASSASFAETVTLVSTTTTLTASSTAVAQNTSVTFTAQINPAAMGVLPLTGTVQFTANGVHIEGLNVSNNQAQVTTVFPTPGQVQVQANYSGDPNYAASTGTITETVTPPPDFSVTASGTTTQTVNAGQTATFTNAITVAALYGFNSQVKLYCSLPFAATGTTCTVTPSTLGTGNGTATVNVTTTSRGSAPPLGQIGRLNPWQPHPLLVLLALLLAGLVPHFARERRVRPAGALPLAILTFVVVQAMGCGGNSAVPPPPPAGTPAGTYTITVTGSSSNASHTTTLTLMVN
jgi:Pro-kumamolisin, activation domain/Bacterial Ig-like domain (group 3)